jgi:hypothetical protein
MKFSRALPRFVLLAVTACALSACFDLDQKVSINRSGAGRYTMALSAKGAIGDAIKQDKGGKNDMLKPNKAVVVTEIKNGKVTKTAYVDFKSLSELKLNDETVSLHVIDHGWFGITPSHVRFKRVFQVGNARAKQGGPDSKDEETAKQMMASIFGDHEYTFSVTLPGSIDRIAPLKIGGTEVKPDVTGDFWNGHVVTWRMPLSTLLMAKQLVFEVDFNAIGSFSDAQTQQIKK